MSIPKLTNDLAIIAKLGDNPGTDNGLSTEAFRAKFDESGLIIQEYINETLVPNINAAATPQYGLTMEGTIDMNGQFLTGLREPEVDSDAATKKYVETYAESLRSLFTIEVPASGWSATAPYKQTIALSGIRNTDTPKYGVVYSSDVDTALVQKDAFTVVDDLETANGSVTFTCFEDNPEVDLTIQLEVNR